jgi:hypothetical protein
MKKSPLGSPRVALNIITVQSEGGDYSAGRQLYIAINLTGSAPLIYAQPLIILKLCLDAIPTPSEWGMSHNATIPLMPTTIAGRGCLWLWFPSLN